MASKGTRYTEEQIIHILKDVEGGTRVAEVCRKYAVSEQTVYRWRSKYGGLDTSELQRLRELEAENVRLKKIVAQQVLDIDALKDLVSKNGKPSRTAQRHQSSDDRSRAVAASRPPVSGGQRSTVCYQAHARLDEAATVALIRDYAHEQPTYGYRIITAMLKHVGYRIWRQEGLQLPRRRTSKRRYGDSTGKPQRASRPNQVWTYDFLEARTERGGKLRMLTVLDEYTRECLTIHVARSISSRQVIAILDWLFLVRGAPEHLRSDNGPEFIAYAFQQWLKDQHCQTLYIKPGSPWEIPSSRGSTARFPVTV